MLNGTACGSKVIKLLINEKSKALADTKSDIKRRNMLICLLPSQSKYVILYLSNANRKFAGVFFTPP